MAILSKLWRAGTTALIVIGFVCIPGRADTRPHEYPAGDALFCSSASKNAHNCAQTCEPQKCPEGSDSSAPHIVQTPRLPRPSARPDQSRPAYSRKSNRTQRA
jgi:hypothetical protein